MTSHLPLEVTRHDPDAEESALGAAILAAQFQIREPITSLLSLSREDFYEERNAIVFDAISALEASGRPPDMVQVAAALREARLLDRVGAEARISDLTNRVAAAEHGPHYVGIVRAFSRRRRLAALLKDAAYRAETMPDLDADEFAAETVAKLVDLPGSCEFIHRAPELSRQMLRESEEAALPVVAERCLSTGVSQLDKLLGRISPGMLVLIAGRPSAGKSSLANTMAHHILSSKKKILYVTCEVRPVDAWRNIVSAASRISALRLAEGDLSRDEWAKYAECGATAAKWPAVLMNHPDTTVDRIRTMAKREVGLRGIIVDYLQLLESTHRDKSREREVALISRRLKGLALELDIPVIALSQLNREAENRKDRMPTLADLRESGALEQDADKVILLENPDPKNNAATIDIITRVAKNRAGPKGDVQLKFGRAWNIFMNGSQR